MLRVAVVVLSVTACDGRPPLPPECQGRLCILEQPPTPGEDCCDSSFCYFDERNDQWQLVFCDPPIETDPCDACVPGEICVQRFDEICSLSTRCIVQTVDCPDNACSAECQAAYCEAPAQCEEDRVPCGIANPVAFTCYAP